MPPLAVIRPVNVGEVVEAAPISLNTSDVDRDSNPLAVNLAYSSSATEALSTTTLFVSAIPLVKLAWPPMSLNTSEVERDSKPEAVNRAYSSSATEALSTITLFVSAIPLVKRCLFRIYLCLYRACSI